MKTLRSSLLLGILLIAGKVISGNYSDTIIWLGTQEIANGSGLSEKIVVGENITNLPEDGFQPYYLSKVKIQNAKSVSIENFEYTSIALNQDISAIIERSAIEPKLSVQYSKNQCYLVLSFPLLFNQNNQIQKITSFEISYSTERNPLQWHTKSNENFSSPNGTWHKLALTKDGAYSITYEELLNWGVISSETPNDEISLVGNSGSQLPYLNGEGRPEGLQPIPLFFEDDNNDGIFGPNDLLLFYGEKARNMVVNAIQNKVYFSPNDYTDTNYVFIKVDGNFHAGIDEFASNQSTLDTIKSVNRYYHHENEWLNFIKSGRIWVGEDFQSENPRIFNLTLPGIDTSKSVFLDTRLYARSSQSIGNDITIFLDSDSILNTNIPAITSIFYRDYVRSRQTNTDFKVQSPDFELKFRYTFPTSSSFAWLDYFTLNYHSFLELTNEQIEFYNFDHSGLKLFEANSSSPFYLWKINDYHSVINHDFNYNSGKSYIKTEINDSSKYICFSKSLCHKPEYKKQIQFQNLKAASAANLLIVAPTAFYSEATALAQLHQREDQLSYKIVTTEDIYNEYASGRPEATAIRDFVRQLYTNPSEDSLRFVLLFGNSSQDQKNINSKKKNWIPSFQSLNSTELISSFVSDDFFGLMDENEGDFSSNGLLDIAIGRLPVTSKQEAEVMLEKINQYYNNGSELQTFKDDWNQRIHFVADDGDSYLHMSQAEKLSVLLDTTLPHLNISKTYLDAYVKERTTVKPQIIGAENSIKKAFNEGNLIINYTGHGGEYGWAAERVLTAAGIQQMENKNYPVLVTASCEFARFDSPKGKSAGELIILKENGGVIGLMTTVRLVFANQNFQLNRSFYQTLSEHSASSNEIYLGELFMDTKVRNNGGLNDWNFTLLGDPALRLQFPKPQIEITNIEINGVATDTIKALDRIRIIGRVKDQNGNTLNSYSGPISISIFDKREFISSLDNNNEGSPFDFWSQGPFLTRARSNVVNGTFETEMIIPKNVKQYYDIAKLSFLSSNSTDLKVYGGSSKDFILGGIDSTKLDDSAGPSIELLMNDSSFTFGQELSNPVTLIAEFNDPSGINITSNEVGNDILVLLNDDRSNEIVLNDYFEAASDDPTKGIINYPFGELPQGSYTLELKAHDNLNNQSKAYTEFVIAENANLALEHLLNYPNPFTTSTAFYFEQNQNEPIDFLIQIFTISGKEIKSIQSIHDGTTKRVGPIQWDGKDEFGDNIGRGVYIYKLTVKFGDQTETLMNKMVILK